MAATPTVGARLSYDGAACTVRYVGEVAGTSGSWLGVEWDDATRGKHDGAHKGTRYFTCKSKSSTAASFVRPTRTAEAPRSFVAALRDKYTSEISAASAQIKFSGKIAEEVGFDKTRRKQADLAELKFAILDGSRIAHAYTQADDPIRHVCPKIVESDLSRNLFARVGTVVDICAELPALRGLRLNGNRFQDILQDERLGCAGDAFKNVKDLALEETLMSWEEICHVATRFPALAALSADANQLSALPYTPLNTLSSTLVSLNLEFNEFTSLADIANLSEMKVLRNLHLKGNNIVSLAANASDTLPQFSQSVQYLDISYNKIASWEFIEHLPTSFPGLVSLRFAHNPIYDNPDPEHSIQSKTVTEEAYMITVGRLAQLKALNFGTISPNNRQDAEMFYLARIGKHLAAVAESEEAEVIRKHKRYAELCELYGPPVVNRQKQVNPAFLEARLVKTQFIFHAEGHTVEKATKIPQSFDIYRVKGVAARLFGHQPLALRLIWETGEWDPVAGFDDEAGDSSEDDDNAGTVIQTDDLLPSSSHNHQRTGRWIKREVELQDGPRQLGFCVDGLTANIRVELRSP